MDVQQVYAQYKNMVYRLALSYMKSRADAEDVCQTVFLRLLERQDAVRPGREKAWLAAVTVNLCRDQLRMARRRQTEPLTEELAFETPEQGGIFHAVMALKPQEGLAVHLYYYEGYSTKEIGKLLGISQTAVTTRLGRARKHLREKLEEMEHE